ncbi:methionine/alanine import family NSS transporter small subunit [Rothia sp. CCM 9419]
METSAVMMMTISILMIWGGLAAATVNLSRHPEEEEDSI